MKKIYKGDIYYADLNPVYGSEQGGVRPVVIVQNNIGNKYSSTVLVAPITRKILEQPTHIFLNASEMIKYDSTILLEQIRVLDKKRLQNFIGKIPAEKMDELNKKIYKTFGLKGLEGKKWKYIQ